MAAAKSKKKAPAKKKKAGARPTTAKPGAAAPRHRIFGMAFARIYPAWVKKAERKGRTREEVDQILRWLTGYTPAALKQRIAGDADLEAFFDQSPAYNPAATLITGTVCGVRVEEVADPLMKRIRQLDKLVDELAQGRPMEKILRRPPQAAATRTPR